MNERDDIDTNLKEGTDFGRISNDINDREVEELLNNNDVNERVHNDNNENENDKDKDNTNIKADFGTISNDVNDREIEE